MSDGGRERGPLDFDEDDAATPPSPAPATRPRPPARDRPRAASSAPSVFSGAREYVWVVGVAALVLIVVLFASTLRHGTDRGARGLAVGETVPPFAAATAASRDDAPANLARRAGEGARHAACDVRRPDVLNGCALVRASPTVIAFFTVRNKKCIAQVDAMERLQSRVPTVRMIAIAIRGEHSELRDLATEHRWTIPVGFDSEGGLSNAFHVQICPQLTFARRGGAVVETTFGKLTDAELLTKARRLQGT